ncbi:uncharacterized protein LOC143452255 isoform X1 [Clavelina lepadiformis]|uniref:uncharacterized protein LOC143452255 isoform X1 n=1 Tax=Clavelina lepadiformis TaxID=159417 RepID=UPI004041D918
MSTGKLLSTNVYSIFNDRAKNDLWNFPKLLPADFYNVSEPEKNEQESFESLGGIFPHEKDKKHVESSSIERCWSTSIKIQFAYEKCAIIGINGGCVSFGGCKVSFPKNALESTYEFKFTLFYGKSPDELVLTPALHCVPASEFRKPLVVQFPTCYVPEKETSVKPHVSQNGKTWQAAPASSGKPVSPVDGASSHQGRRLWYSSQRNVSGIPDNAYRHGDEGPRPMNFLVNSLSWLRVDCFVPGQFNLLVKHMLLICYRHRCASTSPSDLPEYTWELRDEVMDSNDLVNNEKCFRENLTIRSGKDLEVTFTHYKAKIKPDKINIESEDVFKQGFFLRQNFQIEKNLLDPDMCTCMIKYVPTKSIIAPTCTYIENIIPVNWHTSDTAPTFEKKEKMDEKSLWGIVRSWLPFYRFL